MLFKLSNLNSNLALTLGYLNPALNNSAQAVPGTFDCRGDGKSGKDQESSKHTKAEGKTPCGASPDGCHP